MADGFLVPVGLQQENRSVAITLGSIQDVKERLSFLGYG